MFMNYTLEIKQANTVENKVLDVILARQKSAMMEEYVVLVEKMFVSISIQPHKGAVI